jgi:predicted DNA-binding transcriptional regulator AlpA
MSTIPAPAPLLLTGEQAAALADISRAHWWALHSAARVPFPVRLGRAVRWRRGNLERWLAARTAAPTGGPRHE